MTTRIACTALTGRILMGRISSDGIDFLGEPKDVTSDVLKAIIEKLEHHGGEMRITENGKQVAKIKLEKEVEL